MVKECSTLKKHGTFFTLDLYMENDSDLIKKLEHLSPAIINEYTQRELETASWLRITPQWNDFFPYPDDYQNRVYKNTTTCLKGHNLVQIADFCIDTEIKKMKMPFLQLNWIFDEIFASNKIREILENTDLCGYGYRPVWIRSSGKMQPNFSQMIIDTVIPPAFDFSKMDIETEDTCSCGVKRWSLKQGSPLVLKKDIIGKVKNIDIFKTSEFFGRGDIWAHMIFISHNFYMALRDSKSDFALSFELPEYV